jgi:molybdopterin-binding protein
MNVSGRNILHRIRRSKKGALNSRVSIPTPRLGRVLKKQVVKKKVEQGIIRTGIDIAPKSFEKNVIGSDGKLNSLQHKQKCMGKKYPYKT